MLSRSSTITRSSERAAALSRRDTLRPSSRQNKKSIIKTDKESEKFKVRRAKITRLEQEQMLEDDIAVRLIQVCICELLHAHYSFVLLVVRRCPCRP